ncbi:MAG: apolipoprotein N-acyltransferase [Magnetospirillum sp.]|nr:apolipoprotein N-acyltransferase [Magnetospirillum sp.]
MAASLRTPLSGATRLGALAIAVVDLTGWRRRGLAVLLGLLAALALPPVGAVPVLIVSFPGLVWLLDGSRSGKAGFGAGWWWGLGFFSAGFYWIGYAMMVEPEKFAWMIPFATIGLGGFIALFTGAATWAVYRTKVRGPGRVLLLAVAWTAAEWVRSWILTGFPWNPIGSVWDGALPVLQIGAATGIWGLSLLTVVAFAMPAVLADIGAAPRRAALAALAALPLAVGAAWGGVRLDSAPAETVDGVRLRLVQATVAQRHKWQDDLREAYLREHLALSRGPGFDRVTTVIWPETAAPFFLDLDLNHRLLAATAAPTGGLLITGAPRITPKGVQPMRLWNSLLAIAADAEVAGIYDKVHLVPFGEYVPLRGLLPIDKITHGAIDFSPGDGLRTLDLPGLPPVSPLICYEAIFPAAVVGTDQARPRWLINLTNDGWFGISAGPYQHFAAARMRAVEEGLPLVRVANTGISAVTDGYGRVIARLGLGERGVVDAPLPTPPPGLTPYARWGNLIALLLAVLVGALGWALRRLP